MELFNNSSKTSISLEIFISITTFSTAIIGAILIEKINIKNKKIISSIIILIVIFSTVNYWQAKEYKIYHDSFFEKDYPSTRDIGESSPIWSIRSMDKYPKGHIELINGNARIVNYSRTSTKHKYLVDAKEDIRIRENTLYFPGWKIYDNYKLIENIEFQDPKNRGLITFELKKGLHYLIISFEDTKVRLISNLISIISIILIPIIIIIFLLFPNLANNRYKW